ncbi:hypothetical protein V1514DRAFT_356859 [Lipomyces japonicus]|uniref:uncharacterized protein n=1 Tax=Lipomyces japonicus TaxID=56871 RepID=UPI0034CDF92D
MSDPSINVLWSLVVDLSSALRANREATARLFRIAESVANTSTAEIAVTSTSNALAALENLTGSELSVENIRGLLTEDSSRLAHENKILRDEAQAAREEAADLEVLTQQYDHTLDRIMDALRQHATDNATTLLDLHKTYRTQLDHEQAKYSKLFDLFLEQEKRIRGLTQNLRAAVSAAHNDGENGDGNDGSIISAMQALEVENQGLRRALGLP